MRSRSATQLGGIVASVLVSILLAGCATPDAPKVIDQTSPDDTSPAPGVDEPAERSGIEVSVDVADGLAQALEDEPLSRWDQATVEVAVDGNPTPRDLEVVDTTLAELADLAGVAFRRVDTTAELTISFTPPEQWPPSDDIGTDDDKETSDEEVDVVDMGLTLWESDGDGAITDADVFVDSTLDQGLRNSTISHELAHAVGIGHVECITSFVDGGLDSDVDWELSDFDRELVHTWYDPAIPLLASSIEVDDLVDALADSPACEPWRLEAVSTDEGLLACEVAFAEYRSCMPYDGLGPVPSLDAWSPTDWVSTDWIYDYDPARYELVDYEGQRVLCELEGEGRRRPCEVTDGPGPVVDVTLWTDGEYMYDSP